MDPLVPVLVRGGQAEVLDHVDQLPNQVPPCSELPGGGELGDEHGQGVGHHDDQEHLECLPQGEEGVEGVGGWVGSSRVSVVPPVKFTPWNKLLQTQQLNLVIWILIKFSGPEVYFFQSD